MKQNTTLIRVRVKDIKKIRSTLPKLKSDAERIHLLNNTSLIKLDAWLGKPIKFKKKILK